MGYVKIGGGLGEKTGRENLLSALAGPLFASSPFKSWLLDEGEEEEVEVGGASNATAGCMDVGLLILSVQYVN